MAIIVERPASGALLRRVQALDAALKPGSEQWGRARQRLKNLVYDDHTDMLLRGVDRYGRPRAPLAESTLKNKRRGPGPSLIPRGRSSRFIANFVVAYSADGTELTGAYVNVLSKKGRPFVQYHLTGGPHLPRRDVGGITPRGWAQIRTAFARFVAELAAVGRDSSNQAAG